jgi:hypothetical protein
MFVAREPQGTTGRVAAPEPSHKGGRVWSHRTCDSIRVLPSKEAGSGATGHVAVPEFSLAGWRVRSHLRHGSRRAHLDREAGNGTAGNVAACRCTSRSLS